MALVVAVAVLLRAAYVADTADDPLIRAFAIDARFYREMGERFAAGDPLFRPGPLWFAPLYPVLVGSVFSLFGSHPGPILAGQLVLGVATAWLGWKLGSRFSPLAGRVAGLALAITPVPLVYEMQLLYTTLSVFLAAAYLLVQLRAGREGGRGSAAAAGALLGTLSLASASALLFAPVGAFCLTRARGPRRAAVFVIGVALPLLPVLLRNGLVGGEWTPITANGGMLLATGFAPESLGGRALLRTPWDFGPDGAYVREAERATGRKLTLAEASRWQRDRAIQRIVRDPGWAVALTLRKGLLLVNRREIDDNLGWSAYADRSVVLRLVPAPWAWLVLGAAPGVVLAFRRRDGEGRDARGADARTLVAFATVYAVSLLPFFVTARYRLPLIVPLAVLAGFAVSEIRAAIRRGAWRALALPGVAVLLCAGPVLRDPGVREDPAVALNAAAAALLGEGRAEDALALLDRAVARDPRLPGAHANRALALIALGRAEEALNAAVEATRLDPDLAEAWRTRGALLARSGRVAEAVPAFRRVVELRPRDPAALGDLARALEITGQRDEAIRVGRAAVEAGAADLAEQVAGWERATAAPGAGP